MLLKVGVIKYCKKNILENIIYRDNVSDVDDKKPQVAKFQNIFAKV